MQVKALARAPRERELEPLEEQRPSRWTCGSSPRPTRDLTSESQANGTAKDLFYRLKRRPSPPYPPSAANRREDNPLAGRSHRFRSSASRGPHGTDAHPSVSPRERAGAALLMRPGPRGNVRELENAVEHAFVVCPGRYDRLARPAAKHRPSRRNLRSGNRKDALNPVDPAEGPKRSRRVLERTREKPALTPHRENSVLSRNTSQRRDENAWSFLDQPPILALSLLN
jgi:DNA-binding NtrC family response regulator